MTEDKKRLIDLYGSLKVALQACLEVTILVMAELRKDLAQEEAESPPACNHPRRLDISTMGTSGNSYCPDCGKQVKDFTPGTYPGSTIGG